MITVKQVQKLSTKARRYGHYVVRKNGEKIGSVRRFFNSRRSFTVLRSGSMYYEQSFLSLKKAVSYLADLTS